MYNKAKYLQTGREKEIENEINEAKREKIKETTNNNRDNKLQQKQQTTTETTNNYRDNKQLQRQQTTTETTNNRDNKQQQRQQTTTETINNNRDIQQQRQQTTTETTNNNRDNKQHQYFHFDQRNLEKCFLPGASQGGGAKILFSLQSEKGRSNFNTKISI